MILPDIGDFAPVGFIVASSAFFRHESALMRILMARDTLGLQPEIRSVAAAVLAVVTVRASGRPVSAFERPTRLAMIEQLRRAARPPNEPGIPSEMLDVTATALLPAVLAPVEARLLPYLGAQVLVTAEASVAIEPLSCRMALGAILIAIDVGVVTGELSGGQKLGAGWARYQCSGNRGHNHQAAHDHQCCDAPPHSENIQRYP
jgi:hypothetical protein